MAEGFVVAAAREYKAAATMPDVKEDRDRAYQTAVKAGDLRLRAEARLGELAGRLATQDTGRPKKPSTNGRLLKDYGLTWKTLTARLRIISSLISLSNTSVTHLKDIGLTKMDSSRAQKIFCQSGKRGR